VTSAKYMYNFTVAEKPIREKGVLSVSSNKHLLVGSYATVELHIYNTSGRHMTTLNVPKDEVFNNAVWTRRGNIVCKTERSVTVLSINKRIVSKIPIENADSASGYLSGSQDGDIYISNSKDVSKLTDDGMTLSVQFSTLDIENFVHLAIKVSSDQHNDIFWTVESKHPNMPDNDGKTELYVYTLNKTASNVDQGVSWSRVAIPTNEVSVYFLTFDSHTTIFALASNIQDVLMWSVNGTYHGQLHLLLDKSLIFVNGLAVDSADHTMYVVFSTEATMSVGVFTLTYDESS
jgi:hypothetical protein